MGNTCTISVHAGSQVHFKHNKRDPETIEYQLAKENPKDPHIDVNGHFEIWKDRDLKEVYRETFKDAVDRHNAKQTRKDRMWDYDHEYNAVEKEFNKKLNGDKNKNLRNLCEEMIIGIYPEKDENGNKLPLDLSEKEQRDIIYQFYKDFEKNNPNVKVVGAYFHADEPHAGLHAHIDYIIIGHDFEKGLDTQVSKLRGCKEMGYEREIPHLRESKRNNAFVSWSKAQRDHLQELVETKGMTVVHPDAGKNKKHIDTANYKYDQIKKQTKAAKKELTEIREEKENLQAEFDIVKSNYKQRLDTWLTEERDKYYKDLENDKAIKLKQSNEAFNAVTEPLRNEIEELTKQKIKMQETTFVADGIELAHDTLTKIVNNASEKKEEIANIVAETVFEKGYPESFIEQVLKILRENLKKLYEKAFKNYYPDLGQEVYYGQSTLSTRSRNKGIDI